MNGADSRRLPGASWPGTTGQVRPSASRSLELAARPDQVADLLFDLGQLQHWWPGVQRVLALPGGVRGSGDLAVLQGPHGDQLLRVLRHWPGLGLRLLISGARQTLLLDLALRPLAGGSLLLLHVEALALGSVLHRAWQGWSLQWRASRAMRAFARRFRPRTGAGQ